jgi:hypothetical protein
MVHFDVYVYAWRGRDAALEALQRRFPELDVVAFRAGHAEGGSSFRAARTTVALRAEQIRAALQEAGADAVLVENALHWTERLRSRWARGGGEAPAEKATEDAEAAPPPPPPKRELSAAELRERVDARLRLRRRLLASGGILTVVGTAFLVLFLIQWVPNLPLFQLLRELEEAPPVQPQRGDGSEAGAGEEPEGDEGEAAGARHPRELTVAIPGGSSPDEGRQPPPSPPANPQGQGAPGMRGPGQGQGDASGGLVIRLREAEPEPDPPMAPSPLSFLRPGPASLLGLLAGLLTALLLDRLAWRPPQKRLQDLPTFAGPAIGSLAVLVIVFVVAEVFAPSEEPGLADDAWPPMEEPSPASPGPESGAGGAASTGEAAGLDVDEGTARQAGTAGAPGASDSAEPEPSDGREGADEGARGQDEGEEAPGTGPTGPPTDETDTSSDPEDAPGPRIEASDDRRAADSQVEAAATLQRTADDDAPPAPPLADPAARPAPTGERTGPDGAPRAAVDDDAALPSTPPDRQAQGVPDAAPERTAHTTASGNRAESDQASSTAGDSALPAGPGDGPTSFAAFVQGLGPAAGPCDHLPEGSFQRLRCRIATPAAPGDEAGAEGSAEPTEDALDEAALRDAMAEAPEGGGDDEAGVDPPPDPLPGEALPAPEPSPWESPIWHFLAAWLTVLLLDQGAGMLVPRWRVWPWRVT